MKVLLITISAIIAILTIAITNKEALLTHLESFVTKTSTTINLTTAFRGLPLFPPISIYGHPKPANMTVSRAIRKAFLAIEQSEGAGARVRRSIGTPQLRNFSPFLMLDHFTSSPGAGFPDHPHRGQETVCPQEPFLNPNHYNQKLARTETNVLKYRSHTSSMAPSITKTSQAMLERSRRVDCSL